MFIYFPSNYAVGYSLYWLDEIVSVGVVVTAAAAVTGFGAGVAVIFDDKGSQEGSQQSVLVEEENESERVIHRHIYE